MKILGALLISLACVGIGLTEVHRLTATQRLWQDWVRLLAHLHTELRYTARPMQEILAALDKRRYPALGWLAEFTRATDEMHLPCALSADEITFANGFFGFVGASDLDGQLAHIAQYTERANDLLKAAADRRCRLARVYVSTATCAGLCIGIMIL